MNYKRIQISNCEKESQHRDLKQEFNKAKFYWKNQIEIWKRKAQSNKRLRRRLTSRIDHVEVRRSGMGDKIDKLERSTLTKLKIKKYDNMKSIK